MIKEKTKNRNSGVRETVKKERKIENCGGEESSKDGKGTNGEGKEWRRETTKM